MSESLSIARLVTRCRAPRRLGVDAALVDRAARGPFLRACARELDGLHIPGPCRIRRLMVRLTVTPADLNEGRLPTLWASAFARSLRAALTRPDGHGPAGVEVVRAESRAAWLARWIADSLTGRAGSRWEYEEFRPLDGLGTTGATIAALLAEPGAIADVLAALDDRGVLDRLLALLDDYALERLIAAASAEADPDAARPSVADVAAVGALASGLVPVARGKVADRRLALRLFVLFRREPGGLAPATPRRVQHALSALAALLEITAALGGGLDALARADGTLEARAGGAALPAVTGLLAGLRDLARADAPLEAHADGAAHPAVTALLAGLRDLARADAPLEARAGGAAHPAVTALLAGLRALARADAPLEARAGGAALPAVTGLLAGLRDLARADGTLEARAGGAALPAVTGLLAGLRDLARADAPLEAHAGGAAHPAVTALLAGLRDLARADAPLEAHAGGAAHPAVTALLAGLRDLARADGTLEARAGGAALPAVTGLLAGLRDLARRSAGSPLPLPLADLSEALAQLRPLAPPAVVEDEPWVSSDVAGLFLLVGSLERLGWPRRWLSGPLGAAHGPRAVNFLLGGLALAVIGQFPKGIGRLDPGLALFAGFLGEPDLGGMSRFFEAPMPGGLTERGEGTDPTPGWAAELDALSEVLIRAFAAQIRGFREASRAFLVSRLIATPGRVRLAEDRLRVRLAPNPLHVALHVSGMDYPVGPVGWYGDRSVEFELEGL